MFGMWRRVRWTIGIDVTNGHGDSIFRAGFSEILVHIWLHSDTHGQGHTHTHPHTHAHTHTQSVSMTKKVHDCTDNSPPQVTVHTIALHGYQFNAIINHSPTYEQFTSTASLLNIFHAKCYMRSSFSQCVLHSLPTSPPVCCMLQLINILLGYISL